MGQPYGTFPSLGAAKSDLRSLHDEDVLFVELCVSEGADFCGWLAMFLPDGPFYELELIV